MKYWYSPLLITAALLFIYAVYLWIHHQLHPDSWAYLLFAPALLAAAASVALHFPIRFIPVLKKKFLVELVLLILVFIWFFLRNR